MDPILRQFLSEHGNDDTTKLLFSRKKWPDIDMDLAVNTIEGRKRIAPKVPEWGMRDDLLYPTRLCTEQCSSSITAAYKASIAKRMGFRRIADLTGGLGIDSWHFAKIAAEVLHNEADERLSACTSDNFRALGTMNIRCSSKMVMPGNVATVLDDFGPDVVFMDPARRSDTGKKVFLIEDCQPDVLGLRDEIFGICRHIFLKLSPMADITMAVERLGHVTEVHSVAAGGECKELLILMDRESDGKQWKLFVHDSGSTIEVSAEDEKNAVAVLPSKNDASWEGGRLFEPGKALAKAGIFNSICNMAGLVKLGRSTNLYLAGGGHHGLEAFGKTWLIKDAMPLDKRSMKELGERLGWADVTARNIPLSSEDLARKMGLSLKKKKAAGAALHVFGVRVDWKDAQAENLLFVAERIVPQGADKIVPQGAATPED